MAVSSSDAASRDLKRASDASLRQFFEICTPVVMAILFFAVLTPIGIVMRLIGRDPLRLRFEPHEPSYWVARTSPGERQVSMTKQF